jgi:hypothetical protein
MCSTPTRGSKTSHPPPIIIVIAATATATAALSLRLLSQETMSDCKMVGNKIGSRLRLSKTQK